MKSFFLSIIGCLFSASILFAQGIKDIKLVVTGEAANKETAITHALRSAIEMSFGTFVSANTTILNDELVKDEVATISSGNIKSYKELGCVNVKDGYSVTLEAIVSLDNLVSYARSKGSSCEFAGQTFAMNIKMKELNRQNEISAIKNLQDQMSIIAKNVFDVTIETLDPSIDGTGYKVPLKISLSLNEAANSFYQLLTNTLSSISIKDNEYDEYKKASIPVYKVELSTVLREYGNCRYIYEYVFRDETTHGVIMEILRMPLNEIYYNVQFTDRTVPILVKGDSFKMYQNFPLLLLKRKVPTVLASESEKIAWYLDTIKSLKKDKKKAEAKVMEQELNNYRRQLERQNYSNLAATSIDVNPYDELTKERNNRYGNIQKYRNSPGDPTVQYNTYYWNTNDTGAPNSFICFNHYITREEATGEIKYYFENTPTDPIESIVINYRTSSINNLIGFTVSKQ